METIIRNPHLLTSRRSLRDHSISGARRATVTTLAQNEDSRDAVCPRRLTESEVEARVFEACEAVREQFLTDIAAARERAQREGRREGTLQGVDEGRRALMATAARLDALAETIGRALHERIGGLEEIAIEIAFAAVCKILGEKSAERSGVAALVRAALAQVRAGECLAVRLCPSDHALLRETGEECGLALSHHQVQWIADEEVSLGGCVIETESGDLDARLETLVDRLRRVLLATRLGLHPGQEDHA